MATTCRQRSSPEGLPIQSPVLDRLGNMLFPDGLSSFQVGNCPGYFQDAGIGTGIETKFFRHYLRKLVPS